MNAAPLTAAIALGSNLHDRAGLLRSAVRAIDALADVTITAASDIEETAPLEPMQPKYLNQMVLVETSLSVVALLNALQAIETLHGRVRTAPKGSRTLDLDIVYAEGLSITSRELLVPHPGLLRREFWQRELAQLLGVESATKAIAAAEVHAGMDTAGNDHAPSRDPWSDSWEIVA